jgi:hypothetical protein
MQYVAHVALQTIKIEYHAVSSIISQVALYSAGNVATVHFLHLGLCHGP